MAALARTVRISLPLTTSRGKTNHKGPSYLHCRHQRGSEPPNSSSSEEREEKKKEERPPSSMLKLAVRSIEKMGMALQSCVSPRQKGDWRDAMLMSVSFAVYIYISQQIVCAYCAWTSLMNHYK